jgi:hypothetical protein
MQTAPANTPANNCLERYPQSQERPILASPDNNMKQSSTTPLTLTGCLLEPRVLTHCWVAAGQWLLARPCLSAFGATMAMVNTAKQCD